MLISKFRLIRLLINWLSSRFGSVRLGSVRFGQSSLIGSGPVSCPVLSGRVPRLWAMRPSSHRLAPLAGRASVRSRRSGCSTPRSGPGGAVARRLGQVPAELSLDASVRSRRSGRSTPRSGTPTVRVMSCLGHAPVSLLFGAARGAGLGPVLRGTPARFGSVRFDSDRSSPVISSIY